VDLSRLVLLVLLVLACTGLGVGVVELSEREAVDVAPSAASPAATDGPVAVLRDWDRRRAGAWASGDVAGLRSLYVARSTAGERDATRLARWLDQGLRVRRLETQVLRVRVLAERRDRLVLAVTDRIARAEVASGLRLPGDGPSTWRITLRRVAGAWRVAAVSRRASW
jgi:hypothetical protein